jgi:hypothetical protein
VKKIYRQPTPILDRVLHQFGLVRATRVEQLLREERVLQGGYVYCDIKRDGHVVDTLDLGPNLLMYPWRVTVAKILARKAADIHPATFPNGKEGFVHDDPVWPGHIYIGTGTTQADPTDTKLGYYLTENEDFPDASAACLKYALARVIIQDTKAEYDAIQQPINIAFEFDIPDGTLRSGGDAEATPIIIREWALSASNGNDPIQGNPTASDDPQVAHGTPPTLLARKVADLIKLFEMSLTIRWEMRT